MMKKKIFIFILPFITITIINCFSFKSTEDGLGKTAFSFLELRASKGINLALITVSKNKTSHTDNVLLFEINCFYLFFF